MALIVTVAAAQNDPTRSFGRPSPQIAGRLIDTDGIRSVTIAYGAGSKQLTFSGTLHSTCIFPKSGQSLQLLAIPKGTSLTLFYVPRNPRNVILAIRLDRMSTQSSLPVGVTIPCFKPAAPS